MFHARQKSLEREGSTLVLALILVTLLTALSAGLTMTSMVGVRSIHNSNEHTRAFYLADSGAQSAISKIRVSGGTLAAQTFTETINTGVTTVDISIPSADLYRVFSTGTWGNEQEAVEVYVKFTGAFYGEGAISVTAASGVKFDSKALFMSMAAGARVIGRDHDSAGVETGDTSKSKYALSTNPLPNNLDFKVTGTGLVEGVPSATTNKAPGQQAVLTAIRNFAKTNADISFTGSRTLGDAQNGSYGTAVSPKLVYADLTKAYSGKITMKQSFVGHGTLVIDAWDAAGTTALKMQDFSQWNGLVYVYFPRVESNRGNPAPLVLMQNSAKIVGGMSIYFNCIPGDVLQNDPEVLVQMKDSAQILYSTSLLASAPGTQNVAPKSAEVVSYRVQ